MKNKYVTVLIIILTQLGYTQTIDHKLIQYNGLDFYSSKTEIIQTLGNPKDIFNPDYECGFLSGPYLTLDYGKVQFTGNEEESYLIEEINLENDPSIVLTYGEHLLTCETNVRELITVFGKEIEERIEDNENDTIVIPFEQPADDAIIIEIKNGKLIKFGYWSPC